MNVPVFKHEQFPMFVYFYGFLLILFKILRGIVIFPTNSKETMIVGLR